MHVLLYEAQLNPKNPNLTTKILLTFMLHCIAVLAGQAYSQDVVAHRGSSHEAPENTLAAFELAWEQGTDAIEGDFHLTADDQIVCS